MPSNRFQLPPLQIVFTPTPAAPPVHPLDAFMVRAADLYQAAQAKAQRDVAIDRLFNAAYYDYQI